MQVKGTSKDTDKYPVSPELIVSSHISSVLLHLCHQYIFILDRPSSSLLSLARPSSKSFSPCGWLDHRWKSSSQNAFASISDHISLTFEEEFHENFCKYLFACRCKQSIPAALSRGLTGGFPYNGPHTEPPVHPNLAIWKSESGSFFGNPPKFFPALKNVLFFYLPSFNRVLNCI